MPVTPNFTNSELSRFAHEPERRADRNVAPVPAQQAPADPTGAQRSPPNPRDLTLSSLAQAWRARLPSDQRPNALCDRYPRIANRLALCWGDPVLTALVFKDLLTDRRGGRQGFPPAVQRELLVLREAAATRPRTAG